MSCPQIMLQKKALKIKGHSQANEILHPAQEAYSLLDPDAVGINKIKHEFPWLIFFNQDVSIRKITMENPLFMAGRKMLAQGDKELTKLRRRELREEEANLFDSSYSLCQKKALVQKKTLFFSLSKLQEEASLSPFQLKPQRHARI